MRVKMGGSAMHDITLREINGEPRAPDLEIAIRLGFDRPRNIRKLIERNAATLEGFGSLERARERDLDEGIPLHVERYSRGQPTDTYWLNEKQTLFITAKSNTPTAAAITVEMVEVFAAWRAGQLGDPDRGDADVLGFDVLNPDMPVKLALLREARNAFGRGAAQRLWAKLGLPDLCAPATPDAPPPDDGIKDILLFLQLECEVTGDWDDRVRTTKLAQAFNAWAEQTGREGMAPTSFTHRLIALARHYRDPDTGKRMHHAKRSNWYWFGLRHLMVAR